MTGPNATIDLASGKYLRDQKIAGVVNIRNLADAMESALTKQSQLDNGKFTSAEFAVELIEAAGEFKFNVQFETAS